MAHDVLIAGAGLGGLAAAIGAREAGCQVRVLEQASAFSEAGAGIQLGPNATRVLRSWPSAWKQLQESAARPGLLLVRDSRSGSELGRLDLAALAQRQGAPYLTVHRADAHAALLAHAQDAGAGLLRGARVESVEPSAQAVRVRLTDGSALEADALIGADGLWSQVRECVLGDGVPTFTGQLAWRGLLRGEQVPQASRGSMVTVWLGPKMHVVTYPVRAGEALNVVCLVEGPIPGDPRGWDHEAAASTLRASLGPVCAELRDCLDAMPQWRLWALHARPAMASAGEMARGRVALAGDAAHPMLPYLAQGAGMAIEDAWTLQQVLHGADVEQALARYAQLRWQRCARVQARSRRNAWIFHAQGPTRWGRDLAMKLLGESVLDLPWLYRGA